MKARVPLWNTPQKFVSVETDATVGATLGVNLFNPDGSLVTLGQFHAGALAPFGIVGTMSVSVAGQPAKGNVSLTLVNDVADPGQLFGYGTNMAGAKGWYRPALFESTGLLSGGTLSINAGDNTKFDVSQAIVGYTDYSANPASPTRAYAVYGPTTGNAVPSLANIATWVGIQTPGATLVTQSSAFTPAQRRTIVQLGAVISNGTQLIAVNDLPVVMRAGINQIGDFMRAVGPINAGNLISPNGANLSLNKGAGTLFKEGANFVNNPDDPHNLPLAELTAATFAYRTSTSVQAANTTSVNVTQFESAPGVLSTVGNNNFTVQRVYVFTSNLLRIQYGQTEYPTMAAAEAAIATQPFNTESNIAENGVLLCFLIVKKGATNLSDAAQAKFIPASKFGGPVGSGGTSITTTDALPEGAVNLYFTDERAQDAVAAAFAAGTQTGCTVTYNDASGSLSIAVTGGGGGGSLIKLAEIVVGAPTTDIDFTGLNLDTHGVYELFVYLKPNATGAQQVKLFYNGDTTLANYEYQLHTGLGSTNFAGRGNDAFVIATNSITSVTQTVSSRITIMKAAGGRPMAQYHHASQDTSLIMDVKGTHTRNNTANVTDIKLRHVAANGFGAGSFARLYRIA